MLPTTGLMLSAKNSCLLSLLSGILKGRLLASLKSGLTNVCFPTQVIVNLTLPLKPASCHPSQLLSVVGRETNMQSIDGTE